jgi:VanZ family protein
VVAAFVHEALIERRNQGRHVPLPGLLAIVATMLVGVVDECIQLLLPSRVFDWFDMLFNFLAALMAVSAGAALRWARDRWPARGTSQDASG